MGNFKEKLARFMYGRYGTDQLYYALIAAYVVLIIANVFIHSAIIDSLMWVVLIYMMFRLLSRNVYQRRLENEKFLKVWNRVKGKCSLTTRRVKELKTHRYRQCPHCKRMLRLSRRTGKHTVQCPCCHKEFEMHILL